MNLEVSSAPISFALLNQLLPILHQEKKEHFNQIFFLEEKYDDGRCLLKLTDKIRRADTLSLRIGVLYQYGGHTTPIILDKKVRNPENIYTKHKEQLNIYCTDSRAFDVEKGEGIRDILLELSKKDPIETQLSTIESPKVFSVGLDSNHQKAVLNTTRQHDNGSCILFSLVDIELLLRVDDLDQYFSEHCQTYHSSNTHLIASLPPHLMFYTQSVNGKNVCGEVERVGLKQYLNDHSQISDININFADYGVSIHELFEQDTYKSILNSLSRPDTPRTTLKRHLEGDKKKPTPSLSNIDIKVNNNCCVSLQHLMSWLLKENRRNFILDVFNNIYWNLIKKGDFFGKDAKHSPYNAELINDDMLFELGKNLDKRQPNGSPNTPRTIQGNISTELRDSVISLFTSYIVANDSILNRLLKNGPLSPKTKKTIEQKPTGQSNVASLKKDTIRPRSKSSPLVFFASSTKSNDNEKLQIHSFSNDI